MPLDHGARLNHYDVVTYLGGGGMGDVYRATDTRLQRDVALKVLRASPSDDPARFERLRREARAVAALNHPNIVTIHSVEESGGVPFLTMELVEGRTLDSVIKRDGLAPEQFVAVAVPLADAVAAAHAAGITHRDLKPQNVMFGRDGRLKVLDFGVAKFGEAGSAAGEDHSVLTTLLRTRDGMMVGTIPYMSPEQVQGQVVDARSDVFSLGVMFFEMATGRRPFRGATDLETAVAILRDWPPPIAKLAPAFPAALIDIINRSLAKDPATRYPDAAALCEALRNVDLRSRSTGTSPLASVPAQPRQDRPPLIGRHAEHNRLARHLQDAARGTGALVLLGGEPGVGKTWLAEDLLAEGREQHMLALTGRCYEAGTTPFSPFVDIVEQMLRELPAHPLHEALGEDASEVARLVPRIRRVWDDVPEPCQLAPEQQRHILFSAMLDIFRRLAVQRPVVVLLDDLHWADEATVGLLEYLTPHLSGLRVLVVGTYRDIEFDVGKPFEKALAAFARQPHVVRVPIRCLPQSAVAELLAAFGGSTPPAAVVDAIFHETEGNPFFVGEIFRHLSEEGQLFDEAGSWKIDVPLDALDIPEGIRLVIQRRLTRLSEATPTLLTIAAVIGRQFDLALVEALSTLDGDAFLQSIEEAEAARLIASERLGRHTPYVFTHELIRSTLLSALSLPRRQRLEARIANAMETLYQKSLKPHAAAIAHHLFEAGAAADEEHTIRFLMLASDQAVEAGALSSGLDQIERAFSLVDDTDSPTRITLLWKRGLARRGVGHLAEAIQDWETALQLCDAGADERTVTALCQELAHSYAWTGQPLLGVAIAERGLASLGPNASSDRCRLLGARAWNLSMACDFEKAAPLMRDVLAMAAQLGDGRLQGESLLLSSWHHYLCMQRREQADACRRAEELLRPTRDVAKLGEALVNLQMALLQIGRPRDIARTEEEVRTLSERLGRFDIKVHRLYSEALRNWMTAGDLDNLDVGLQLVKDVAGAWGWLAESCQSQALLWRGHLDAARDRARDALAHEPEAGSHTGPGWSMLFLCDCTAVRREPALSLLDTRAADLPRAGRLNTIGSWCALFKVIEGLAMLGESTRAAGLHPLVVEALANGTVVTFDSSHLLDTVAGIAAAAGNRWDVAETHYHAALRLADDMPFVSEQAEARYWYARMLVDRNGSQDRRRAKALVDEAVAIYHAAGMFWHATRANALAADAPA
jgi:tRNA A-37 threonylcarbamoyl transferase component Bud32/tetratricopeptide (TPR) repeat protein